jgi:hypothetical protein
MNFEDYFKDRIGRFEDERKIYSDYFALILPDKEKRHNLEWENRKLEDATFAAKTTADNLDKELAKIKLQITASKHEIALMKSTKEMRLQQIARLSELSQPIEHDTTYIIREHFISSVNDPRKTNQIKKYDPLKNNNPYKLARTGEVTKLEKQLSDETIRTSSLLQDFNLAFQAAEEDRSHFLSCTDQDVETYYTEARALLVEDDHFEIQCFLAVSELLKLRLRISVAQREEVEELQRLQVDKRYFSDKEEQTREQVTHSVLQ